MQHVPERGAVDVLHGEVFDVAFAAGGVDGDDVGLVQLGQHRSFAAETGLRFGVGSIFAHHFEGHRAVEADLAGFVDFAHAADSDQADDFVVAEDLVAGELALGQFVKAGGCG